MNEWVLGIKHLIGLSETALFNANKAQAKGNELEVKQAEVQEEVTFSDEAISDLAEIISALDECVGELAEIVSSLKEGE